MSRGHLRASRELNLSSLRDFFGSSKKALDIPSQRNLTELTSDLVKLYESLLTLTFHYITLMITTHTASRSRHWERWRREARPWFGPRTGALGT